ncbi:MAG: 16S rRNA (adenine(1518)-N(6)/adenine(1519)-N(6))-dimethyltransferase RsmA [Desulfatibacillaceae bacterium]|nr:16S rRNA (adenine(1518)-N(6)/adenine(1519)-N(6))-dimethyltransferase RsmA [Desulfatibacillaceae bacterium]
MSSPGRQKPHAFSTTALLKAFDLLPKKSMGQNFLKDASTAREIALAAGLEKTDRVVEIGAGLGALTIAVAPLVESLVAVEKDFRLMDFLQKVVDDSGLGNVTVVNADALKIDWREMAGENPPITVIGNLPYNISTPLLFKVVENRSIIKRAVFLFQKELAQRMAASPGGKDYGRVSVTVQYAAAIRPLLHLGPGKFIPEPAVDSTLLELDFERGPHLAPKSEALFYDLVRAAFSRRRKTLKNALAKGGLGLLPKQADDALQRAGIDPSLRAETLSVALFVRLADAVFEVTGGQKSDFVKEL